MSEGVTMTEQEMELLRLKIMEEVNLRFDELVTELNCNGSEYSRALSKELDEMKAKAKRDLDEVWSYVKSQLVSIEQGQKMLYDPKDGLLTKVLRKAEEAVRVAQDSARCTAAAQKAAERSEGFAKEANFYVRGSIVVTIVAFLGIVGTEVYRVIDANSKAHVELQQQKAMVEALQKKLEQDDKNQVQTAKLLVQIDNHLKEANGHGKQQ